MKESMEYREVFGKIAKLINISKPEKRKKTATNYFNIKQQRILLLILHCTEEGTILRHPFALI